MIVLPRVAMQLQKSIEAPGSAELGDSQEFLSSGFRHYPESVQNLQDHALGLG